MARKGTLSDAQTLGMVEDGMSVIALCVHEGMTPYGIYGRLYRARRGRYTSANVLRRRAAKPQETFTSFEQLNEAVRRLERQLASNG